MIAYKCIFTDYTYVESICWKMHLDASCPAVRKSCKRANFAYFGMGKRDWTTGDRAESFSSSSQGNSSTLTMVCSSTPPMTHIRCTCLRCRPSWTIITNGKLVWWWTCKLVNKHWPTMTDMIPARLENVLEIVFLKILFILLGHY